MPHSTSPTAPADAQGGGLPGAERSRSDDSHARLSFALPACHAEAQNLSAMNNYIAAVAFALSLVSLGFQAHNTKPAQFDKFMVPANIFRI